jgi:hypothetical protein
MSAGMEDLFKGIWLTSFDDFLIRFLASEFDINKVDLEFLFRLNADQERRPTTSGDHLVRVMFRLEDESKGTLKLLENCLDKFSERDAFVRLRVVDIFCQDGDGLRVSFALELIAAVLEDEAKGGGIGDNTVVHDEEIAGGV